MISEIKPRQVMRHLHKLFDEQKIAEITRDIWIELNFTLPLWPNMSAEPEITIHTIALGEIRFLRMRILAKFMKGGAAPCHFTDLDMAPEAIAQGIFETGISGSTIDQLVSAEIRRNLIDLKDYFIKTLNADHGVAEN